MATVGGLRALTLLASAARTASGTSPITGLDRYTGGMFFLDVTAAATDADDTLDVYLQKTPDEGTTWTDFVSFTQVTGTGGAKQFIAEWSENAAVETEHTAPQDAALAAGNVLQGGLIGPQIRVKWVVTDPTGSNASFTFSVKAQFRGGYF